jgi:hypothetical protein
MNLKNQFITHGKIDVLNLATIEKNRSKSDMVYFGIIEITAVKAAINKGNCHKIALGEITVVENTSLKLLIVDIIIPINNVVVL